MNQLQIQSQSNHRYARYEKPREPRFPLTRRGELSYNGTRFPCLIQDISVSGLFIISARELEVGQTLEVGFELTPHHYHLCEIRVQHIDDGCFGAEIIDIAEDERKIFQRYVEGRFRQVKAVRHTGNFCRAGAHCTAQACLIKCQWR
jgi:hypothetical protein